MALPKNFPQSPYEILDPEVRWFPGDESIESSSREKLLPPLVARLRKEVKKWRDDSYNGATETSKALLNYWFNTDHPYMTSDGEQSNFKYYFAQREAIETVIYLFDVAKVKDKYDMIRFDDSQYVSPGLFKEDWKRFVIKMATGSGKTKVLSLLLAWSYFNKLYEEDSELSRNFLIITPNIIVLDRLKTDFLGLKIFHEDPILPENGYMERNWQDDFQLTLHLQADTHVTKKYGNIFLTNIQRVYRHDETAATFEDVDTTNYFLGDKPVTNTSDSKVDLSEVVRDLDELLIMNDEAHHIHDERLAWFQSIQDIDNNFKQRGKKLSLQLDVTATPKDRNGAIFVQTICDYPLVEAIYQNVVKHPVIPDDVSRSKLKEKNSSKYVEKYGDYLDLGVIEWRKTFVEHEKVGKKAILFVMTDDTKNCDDVAQYLESKYSELKGSILTIHTNKSGEISETVSGKQKEELEKLRKESNEIDSWESPYKAIISVLMLKEGWDVRNVTTVVGLRAYSASSNILPEQTLGRGLRKMYRGENIEEFVSVVGTEAFMEFIDSIKNEGVELEKRPMGSGNGPIAPIVIEIDKENMKKDIDLLDIKIPKLSPRIYRNYKNLSELQPSTFSFKKVNLKQYTKEQQREIIFKYIEKDNETHHITEFDTANLPDSESVIRFFTQGIMKELRLIGGYDILYEKIKSFIQNNLFETGADLEDLNVLRNLSEIECTRTIIETLKREINKLTIMDHGESAIQDYIKISSTRPFMVKNQEYLVPQKSVFNKVVGDSHFELLFANFLEGCEDIISYSKNYLATHFNLDYQNTDGDISNYYPDFFVKVNEKKIWIIETKGREDLDDILKIKRLGEWCKDIMKIQKDIEYDYLYVKQEDFEKYPVRSFEDLVTNFESNSHPV